MNKELTILFIEDDVIDRMALERFANQDDFPYKYELAGSIKSARKVLNHNKIDAVIADFNLSDGTINELFDLLKGIPFIVVTGAGDQRIAVDAMKAGAHDYIIKDPNGNHLQTLTVTVANAIKHHAVQKELKQYREGLELLVLERTQELETEIEERKKTEEKLLMQNREYQILNAQYSEINWKLGTSNRDLVIAKEKAEESDRLKTAFLANMSHEIRTPLNAILGFSDLLVNEDFAVEKRRKFIELINSSSMQLLAIISDILDISKIEAGQITPNFEETHINNFIRKIFKKLELELDSHQKYQVKTEIKLGLPESACTAIIDAAKTEQILIKIINNAVKFTETGQITVACVIDSDKLKIEITDTGIGIGEKDHQIIFQRFRQAEEAYTRKFGGTGLGLSIAQGLSQAIDGQIHVDSEPDIGSKFTLSVPYQPSLLPKVTSDKPQYVEPERNMLDKVILVVEDEGNNFSYLYEVLQRTGAEVIHAENGLEAVAFCQSRNDIDLILMDIQLPEMNGLEATIEIRKFNKEIPIIAQTAFAESSDKYKALDSGCNDYVSKPISRLLLLEKIEQYISK